MSISKMICRLPFFKECSNYNLSLWQCPSFLFFILGLINIAAMLGTYFISRFYTDQPQIAALLTIAVSLFIFIIGTVIVHGFDKLLEASKMKTEFIRIASHQLRTPLSSLRWANDLLMDGLLGKPTEEQIEYLKIIKESNQRMLKLINDLLDVTKIEMGSLAFTLRPTDLKKIAEETIEDLSPMAKAKNILINFKAPVQIPLAMSDEEKISMVFSNLIDNAIKYTPGKGEIEVGLEEKSGYIQAYVKDNGVGIPKAQQKNIFQKFFRSDNIMKHETIGSGLGLFIVKAIVDANNGEIWFESQENKGSTFYFKTPITK